MFGGIREPRRMIGQGFLEAQIRVFNRGAKEKAQLTMAVHPETRRTYPLKFQGKKQFVTLVNNVPYI